MVIEAIETVLIFILETENHEMLQRRGRTARDNFEKGDIFPVEDLRDQIVNRINPFARDCSFLGTERFIFSKRY